MTTTTDVLLDALERVRGLVHRVLDGASHEVLTGRVDDQANTVGWLVWHLTRIQDDHLADVAGEEQVWTSGGWAERFGLPFDASATGYAQSPEEVAALDVPAELLRGYHDAVQDRTAAQVRSLSDEDLSRVLDERWDPPVTLAVRLVSVVGDTHQHVGQAAFVRGVLERRTAGG